MQRGPRGTARSGRRKAESFINARFQIIHVIEMLRRNFLSMWIESVDFRSELFEFLLVLEKVEEQRR